MEQSTKIKNPSRKTCEDIIKRILMTEVLEKGYNAHFKTAVDFMSYFESLYPASDSLLKQVQRAVKSLNMPKDSNGYFIINKSKDQLDQDQDISFFLHRGNVAIASIDDCDTLFLQADGVYKDFLIKLIQESITFQDKYVTILPTSNGLLFYTYNKTQLQVLIESLLKQYR